MVLNIVTSGGCYGFSTFPYFFFFFLFLGLGPGCCSVFFCCVCFGVFLFACGLFIRVLFWGLGFFCVCFFLFFCLFLLGVFVGV